MATPGLLQPLERPMQAWVCCSMDFVEGLPKSEGKDYILVVVDKFTKFAHFIGLSHPFSAQKVARVLLDQVINLHGVPQTIVSNKDKVFTSLLQQELFVYGRQIAHVYCLPP